MIAETENKLALGENQKKLIEALKKTDPEKVINNKLRSGDKYSISGIMCEVARKPLGNKWIRVRVGHDYIYMYEYIDRGVERRLEFQFPDCVTSFFKLRTDNFWPAYTCAQMAEAMEQAPEEFFTESI